MAGAAMGVENKTYKEEWSPYILIAKRILVVKWKLKSKDGKFLSLLNECGIKRFNIYILYECYEFFWSYLDLPVENIDPESTTVIKFWHVHVDQLIKIYNISESKKENDKWNNDGWKNWIWKSDQEKQ